MAEGFARSLKGELIEPYSAGSRPGQLNPLAVRAMAEAGVDISGQAPKHVDVLMGIPFDYVITLCDEGARDCPIFPGAARKIHRGFDDPPRLAQNAVNEEDAMSHYRRVRDGIKAFVETLPWSLTGEL